MNEEYRLKNILRVVISVLDEDDLEKICNELNNFECGFITNIKSILRDKLNLIFNSPIDISYINVPFTKQRRIILYYNRYSVVRLHNSQFEGFVKLDFSISHTPFYKSRTYSKQELINIFTKIKSKL